MPPMPACCSISATSTRAIRQINSVLSLQPDTAQALTMLAQAYRFKELYAQSDRGGAQSDRARAQERRASLVAGDSLRLSGKLAEAGCGIRPVPQAQRLRQQDGRPVELLRFGLALRHRQEKARRAGRYLEGPAQPGILRNLRLPLPIEAVRFGNHGVPKVPSLIIGRTRTRTTIWRSPTCTRPRRPIIPPISIRHCSTSAR